MTCFSNVWTKWALKDKFSIQAHTPGYLVPILRAKPLGIIEKWLQKRQVPFPAFQLFKSYKFYFIDPLTGSLGYWLRVEQCILLVGHAGKRCTFRNAPWCFLCFSEIFVTQHIRSRKLVSRVTAAHLTYRLVRVKMTSSCILLARESA